MGGGVACHFFVTRRIFCFESSSMMSISRSTASLDDFTSTDLSRSSKLNRLSKAYSLTDLTKIRRRSASSESSFSKDTTSSRSKLVARDGFYSLLLLIISVILQYNRNQVIVDCLVFTYAFVLLQEARAMIFTRYNSFFGKIIGNCDFIIQGICFQPHSVIIISCHLSNFVSPQ